MSALKTSLPGDIPGLLRHCSPVLWDLDGDEAACVVRCSPDGTYQRVDGDVGGTPELRELRLDLTDATGRAHAAWWVNERAATYLRPSDPRGEDEAVMLACLDADMTPEQIDTLARLVLRLAGRAA